MNNKYSPIETKGIVIAILKSIIEESTSDKHHEAIYTVINLIHGMVVCPNCKFFDQQVKQMVEGKK